MPGEAPFLGKLQELVFVESTGKDPAVRHNFFLGKAPGLHAHVGLKKLLDVQGRVLRLHASQGEFSPVSSLPKVSVRLGDRRGVEFRERRRGTVESRKRSRAGWLTFQERTVLWLRQAAAASWSWKFPPRKYRRRSRAWQKSSRGWRRFRDSGAGKPPCR